MGAAHCCAHRDELECCCSQRSPACCCAHRDKDAVSGHFRLFGASSPEPEPEAEDDDTTSRSLRKTAASSETGFPDSRVNPWSSEDSPSPSPAATTKAVPTCPPRTIPLRSPRAISDVVDPESDGGSSSKGLVEGNHISWSSSIEAEVTLFLEVITGNERGICSLVEWLRDGHVLRDAAAVVQPGVCGLAQSELDEENIDVFLRACRALGISEASLFRPSDLQRGRHLRRIQLCIYAFAQAAQTATPTDNGADLVPSPREEPQCAPSSVMNAADASQRWLVVFDGFARVRSGMRRDSQVIGEREQGAVVCGRGRGEWLELLDQTGFMLIACDGEEVLRQQTLITVTLQKRAGVLPGITWVVTPLGLEIRSIDPDGLVGLWNEENPHQTLEVYDQILEVNGVSDRRGIHFEWTQRAVFVLNVLTLTKQRVTVIAPDEPRN